MSDLETQRISAQDIEEMVANEAVCHGNSRNPGCDQPVSWGMSYIHGCPNPPQGSKYALKCDLHYRLWADDIDLVVEIVGKVVCHRCAQSFPDRDSFVRYSRI